MLSADATVSGPPGLGMRSVRLWHAGGAALLGVQIVAPPGIGAVAMLLILVSGLVAIHVGPNRYLRRADRKPWYYMRAASYLFVVAAVIRAVVPGTDGPTPAALIPNAFVVPAYLGLGLGLHAMLRRRRAAEDDPARTDAMLVGLAAAFLVWTFVITPAVTDAGLNVYRLIDSFFPIVDVLLLALVARLLLACGVRQPALWMLVVSTIAMFVADLLYTLRSAQVLDTPPHVVDSLLMVMFVGMAAAVVHPSMRTLTEPQAVAVGRLSRLRLVVITVVLVVPIVVTSLVPLSTLVNDVVRAVLCVLLVLTVLGRVVRSNNSRARAEAAMRRRATHDALTDLANRELLAETVSAWGDRAAAERLEISLLFLDLDRFKMVNDHWGHQVGDELLRAVAARLGGQARAEDLVCRVGGDEFVVALAGPSHLRLAESLADRLLTEFARPFRLSVGDVVISASIGVAKSHGGVHALELIRDADTAMYKAKGSGRNAYALFDTSLREQVRDRVKLEQALRGASERGELAVHFQPIIDTPSDELDGFEALMRWESPELGSVSPMEFIPIAEETGMIVEMGAWLLRESAYQLREWMAVRGPDARPLHVSVNVAVRQLRDGSLVAIVDDVLRETGLPADSLWLEITESGVMEDIDAALLTLNALHALGVTLCIDDFGTGYSSLSYLHRLPVGVVKIDRSFVKDCGSPGANEPIVRSVLAMTHAMGHRVVAEGVETARQRDWLREQGCDLVQGWLYGKADRPANLTAWIQPSKTRAAPARSAR
ncbi:bifunctional diguanylate cyclase/phosphodiesterase [Actinoplanes sp. TBRC 11911]|uniref:putative bifunctional diguanylate cyclase/phosphodiesterase n=1 Tax=Actinoplanes sp. TBRC 11911 TaxID=2729386 RepID=UPI0020071810|nr:EAL domain-containing protein [Actinoplanes sp. TBRC 11911]